MGAQPWDWLLALPAAIWLFVLPGWALLRLWRGAEGLTLLEQLALGLGLGLALYPTLMLAASLVGLRLGALYAWLPPFAGLALLIALWRRGARPATLAGWRAREPGGNAWPLAALAVVLAVVVAVRCLAVDGLAVPLWGDSVHHAMIAQLMIDNGGLFSSWQPYAAMETFTYHFGFHSHVAVIAWLTGAPTPRAVVLTGQLANIAAVVALYPVALRIGRSRWAGVAALLLAGLLAPMPMFYLNWGRYTQLAGQAIMPAAIYLAWELLAAPRRSWPLLAIACVGLGGMLLTHYRIAIFAACFFPAFAVTVGVRLPWRAWVGRGAWLALGSGALVAPWMLRVVGGELLTILGAIVAASAPSGGASAPSADTLSVMGGPLFFLPALAWYAMLLSVFWALWRREGGALLVALWWLLAALVVNPQLLGLPGAGTLTNFALLIAAYIPAALLVGAAAGWLLRRLRRPLAQGAVALAVAGLALWGAGARLDEIDTQTTAMVAPEDLAAAAWIEANTPPDARFLINGFFPNAGAVVGSDGGWWLPVLAHRQTTLPPLLYISERGPRPDYRLWVNELYAVIHARGVTDPAALALLRERGVTYVYIGQRGGSVGYDGSEQALDPATLRASAMFRLVYNRGQVSIFALEARGEDS